MGRIGACHPPLYITNLSWGHPSLLLLIALTAS